MYFLSLLTDYNFFQKMYLKSKLEVVGQHIIIRFLTFLLRQTRNKTVIEDHRHSQYLVLF